MATYKITNSNSVSTNAAVSAAFIDDTAAADSLTVDQSGFLYASGALSYGAKLAPTLAWKVTVNGVITSTQFAGLGLMENNTAASTITIGTEGEVFGAAASVGVYLGSAATLTNNGTISGGTGVMFFSSAAHTVTNKGIITATGGSNLGIQDFSSTSADTVTNSGTINGNVDLGGGNNKLTNSGFMFTFSALTGDDSVTNSGTMYDVALGNGTNSLTNSGTISGTVSGGSGADKVTNSKTLNGNVDLGTGVNTASNSGTLNGDITADAGSTNTVTNSKTISGSILLDDGNDKVTNSGTVGTVDLGDGINTLTNSGTIMTLMGGAGVDTVSNTGTIFGAIDLGGGDDKYTGGAKEETVEDSDGADTINLGAGNDTYRGTGAATDGLDKIDGGAGVDIYDGSNATARVFINIDTVDHTGALIGSIDPQYTVTKNTVHGTDIGPGDTVLNFETIATGSNDDVVHGNAAVNLIQTGAGNDIILGYGGNDTIYGGDGSDLMNGGVGKDILYGGGADGDTDVFSYSAINESTVVKTGRDIVMDFEDGADMIDLAGIDAKASAGNSNDFFVFIGTNVSFTAAGQVRALTTATGYAIEGDVTGDGKADFAIDILDPTHAISWSSADFVL